MAYKNFKTRIAKANEHLRRAREAAALLHSQFVLIQ